ncbi:VanW family protein [Nocardioides campestrisoli]|uniref:VanW family protein n=1 Tax=Nocardioides campestrisoli TaxID=2736757 RepID=UPI00163D7292|nr:VanW family protein [Nocardioides campestrisoli]
MSTSKSEPEALEPDGTAPDGTAPDEKAGGRVVLLLLVGLLVLGSGAYAAAYQVAGDKVPRGTTVSGVEVGGQSPQEAVETLESGLADRVEAPLTVEVEGEEQSVSPDQAGLSVDYSASVDQAGGGRSWSPARLWDYFTGGKDHDAVVDVDEPTVTELLAQLQDDLGTAPREGAVRLVDGEVKVRSPRIGQGIEPESGRDALVAAYLSEDSRAELEVEDLQPEIDETDVQQALDSFANPAVSAPVSLTFDDTTVTLTPAQYTRVLSLEPVDGALEPTLDEERLADLLASTLGADGGPVEATVRLVNGRPQVVPDKPGATFDQEEVNDAFLDLVAAPAGERELEVTATVARADFRTEDAEALGIKEKVSSFSTYYPHADYRNVNLGRAAELIDGTVLKPGETFSLNDTVGERTRANGFTEGFIIADGIFKEDLGGGVSQMATTVFNAMFFAGLEDVEHKPHSFYIDRYPVGREATVAWGAIDLRFRNDTDHGVLIDAKVTPSTPGGQGQVTVSMWSTKVWDITSTTSGRYAFTAPETRTLSTPDCYPNSGYGGFTVDVKRIFRRPGSNKVVKSETFTTTYTPSDTVVCQPPGDD